MKIYTMGFTQKSAEEFFEKIKKNQIELLIDIRLNNQSQLAGFAKGKDLQFFVNEICGIPYRHITDFAPTKELLDKWHKQEVSWEEYEQIYTAMLHERDVINRFDVKQFDRACFLCSEETPEHCHRRLLAEYFKKHSGQAVSIVHLV